MKLKSDRGMYCRSNGTPKLLSCNRRVEKTEGGIRGGLALQIALFRVFLIRR